MKQHNLVHDPLGLRSAGKTMAMRKPRDVRRGALIVFVAVRVVVGLGSDSKHSLRLVFLVVFVAVRLTTISSASKVNVSFTLFGFPHGGSEGRRSPDLTIFSRALYQLSYRALSQTA